MEVGEIKVGEAGVGVGEKGVEEEVRVEVGVDQE